MAQPLQVRGLRNVIPNENVLIKKNVSLKPLGRSQQDNQENVFRSKIPVFKSRINVNQDDLKPLKKTTSCATLKNKVEEKRVVEPENKLPVNIENIDSDSDCFLLSNYAPDIYKYLHTLEEAQSLKANFLAKHNVVTANMRAVLVNWIVGVHKTFQLCPETLYLSISIMDRVLARERIEKDKLQLLAATAMFVASKFEEVYYPDVKDFVVICDNLYNKRDIIRMELKILSVTNFELTGPSPLYFLRRGSKAAHADSRVHMLGKYLCELSVINYQCAHWLPSKIAATSLYIALRLVKSNEIENPSQDSSVWTPTIEYYTGYSFEDVHKNSAIISRFVISSETSKHQNCRKKYQSSKYLSISNFSPNSMKTIKLLANQNV